MTTRHRPSRRAPVPLTSCTFEAVPAHVVHLWGCATRMILHCGSCMCMRVWRLLLTGHTCMATSESWASPSAVPCARRIFFVSGLNTLLQTTWGDRLPIIQGGSFSFITPAFSIIANVAARGFPACEDLPPEEPCDPRFKVC